MLDCSRLDLRWTAARLRFAGADLCKKSIHVLLQCQIGVLPLGTGNDLARVLGWGSAFDDDTQLPAILERMEHAQIKMLDRWSVYSYEVNMPPPMAPAPDTPPLAEVIGKYEDSVADHLAQILHSDNHNTVISSAK